jgi:hypothetical protein
MTSTENIEAGTKIRFIPTYRNNQITVFVSRIHRFDDDGPDSILISGYSTGREATTWTTDKFEVLR